MKHIFIYNPMAGKDNRAAIAALQEKIKADYPELDVEFYPTKAPKDATAYVKACCEASPDTKMRFYACGGDGTANEVLHGIVGYANASMTCYPCGSGNDYVKYYGGAERFLNIDTLLFAEEKEVDVMRVGDRYSLNVANFGFDTVVAKTMTEVPLVFIHRNEALLRVDFPRQHLKERGFTRTICTDNTIAVPFCKFQINVFKQLLAAQL